MTHRPPDERVSMYRLGFKTALEMCENLARRDQRVELAKSCGYVPGWQKGRWMVADDIAARIKVIEADADGEAADK